MKFKLSLKILVLNVVLIIVTAGALIYFSYTTARNDLEKTIGSRLEAIAATAALMIDGDLHDTIRGPEDANSDAFLTLRETLRAVKKANNLDTEVYTFRREGETLKYIVMTNKKSFIGDTYSIREEMWPALNENKTTHTSIYKDSHGIWLSAYAPILDSKGHSSGIVDVDIKLETYQAELTKKVIRLVIVSAGIMVFAIFLSVFLTRKLVRELHYLKDVTEKISLGQMDRVIRVSSQDEVGELAQSLERMRESLKVAMEMIEEEEDQEE